MPEKFATKYWSANIFGAAAVLEEGPEKQKGIEAILHKYSPQHVEKGLKLGLSDRRFYTSGRMTFSGNRFIIRV